jgi:murein L,D-transpeptidase YcbB/YkuD
MHALAAFRELELAGGWLAISDGPTLREGDSDARVLELRARLRKTGQLASADDTGTELLDTALVDAVKLFQQQHGLAEDGAVGKATLAALNVPVTTRIDQLRMTLERLRWVLGEFEDNMLFVNIAGFHSYLVQDGVVTWEGRVMVGQPFRKTPIFRGEMEYLVFNPTWTIPPSILIEDTLPAILRDPGYLARNDIVVLTLDGAPVDPTTIDWPAMIASGFPYILRQQPGPQNAMGQVKFIFPNEHFVFFHDTPNKNLFGRPERAFSSGCIRVEHPLELAELLLDDAAKWSRADIDALLAKKQTRSIHLRETMPVFLMYITASAEPDGTTHFYRDIYGRDARLLQELMGDSVIYVPGQ